MINLAEALLLRASTLGSVRPDQLEALHVAFTL